MSLFDSTAGDRTERPTQRRRRDARARGLVARSVELVSAVRSFALWVVIASWVATFVTESAHFVRLTLARPPSDWLMSSTAALTRKPATWAMTQLALPLSLVSAFVLIAHFAQTGWLWQPHHALPDESRLSPITGLSRIASLAMTRSFALLIKSLLLLSLLVSLLISGLESSLSSSASSQPPDWVINNLTLSRRVSLLMSLSLLAWGLIDYLWQRRRFERSLRMTKAEVRQELNDSSRKATHSRKPPL